MTDIGWSLSDYQSQPFVGTGERYLVLPFSVIILQGVQEKLCLCTIHCNPSLAYIAVRDLQSSQRYASVQSFLLVGNFLYNEKQPSAGEGEMTNFREFSEKNTMFNEHPVLY